MTELQLKKRLAPYLVLWALGIMAVLGAGLMCQKPEPPQVDRPCRQYEDYNIKPSRKIWEATGMTVAPFYVVRIHSDGAIDGMCFPGPGLVVRLCRDDIPFQTINPFTKQSVSHEVIRLQDTIWWPYYGSYF